MIQQPTAYVPAPPAEFNAIKINISGAKVDAPQQGPQPPVPPVTQAPSPENAGQNLNINA